MIVILTHFIQLHCLVFFLNLKLSQYTSKLLYCMVVQAFRNNNQRMFVCVDGCVCVCVAIYHVSTQYHNIGTAREGTTSEVAP